MLQLRKFEALNITALLKQNLNSEECISNICKARLILSCLSSLKYIWDKIYLWT